MSEQQTFISEKDLTLEDQVLPIPPEIRENRTIFTSVERELLPGLLCYDLTGLGADKLFVDPRIAVPCAALVTPNNHFHIFQSAGELNPIPDLLEAIHKAAGASRALLVGESTNIKYGVPENPIGSQLIEPLRKLGLEIPPENIDLGGRYARRVVSTKNEAYVLKRSIDDETPPSCKQFSWFQE